MIRNPLIQKIGAIAVAILLLVYVGYQVYRGQYTGLKTEPAVYATLSDSISTVGFFVRDEVLVTSRSSGVLNYVLNDGEKVASGGVLAEVYPTEEGAAAKNRIARIDDELAQLSLLDNPGDYSTANPQTLGSHISDGIVSLLRDVHAGAFDSLSDDKNDVQMLLSQKQIVTGKETGVDYREYIATLKAERAELEHTFSARSGAVVSPAAGYFIHTVDGFENLIDAKHVTDVTVGEVRAALDAEPAPILSGAVGKIARSFSWYIVCELSEDDLVRLDRTTNVSVEMSLTSLESIPAEVVQINREEATGGAAVVLECSYMNSELASARKEPINIDLTSYSGVLVDESAVHFNDIVTEETDEDGNMTEVYHEDVRGVYVKSGSRIRFVQIFTDVTINGYAVCKTNLTQEERDALVTDRTIQLYDEVVVEGTDLYDGKML